MRDYTEGERYVFLPGLTLEESPSESLIGLFADAALRGMEPLIKQLRDAGRIRIFEPNEDAQLFAAQIVQQIEEPE